MAREPVSFRWRTAAAAAAVAAGKIVGSRHGGYAGSEGEREFAETLTSLWSALVSRSQAVGPLEPRQHDVELVAAPASDDGIPGAATQDPDQGGQCGVSGLPVVCGGVEVAQPVQVDRTAIA